MKYESHSTFNFKTFCDMQHRLELNLDCCGKDSALAHGAHAQPGELLVAPNFKTFYESSCIDCGT